MRKLKNAAHVYMVLGLLSGVFYREFTRFNDFTGKTQLSVVHTHVLALGMLAFLIVLALDKQFQLNTLRGRADFQALMREMRAQGPARGP